MTQIVRDIVCHFEGYDRMVSIFGVMRKAINLGDDFAILHQNGILQHRNKTLYKI